MRPELIRASELLRRNTPEAVEEAVGLLQNTVYAFSMKMCGHREDAEDTAQDVLFRSMKHLARFSDPAALAAWLYTVTRNRCRRTRRPHAEPSAKAYSLDELMPDSAELQQLLVDTSASPESALMRNEHHNLLHQAVLRLPSTLRFVLVLHDMEDLDTGQVAQILDLQPGTVRVRLHRARLTVRKEMQLILDGNPAPPARAPFASKPRVEKPAECRELFAALSEYLDDRLEPVSCDQMRAHIAACPNCVAFLHDLRAAIDRCRSLTVPCDPALTARMKDLFTREYLRMLDMPIPDKVPA